MYEGIEIANIAIKKLKFNTFSLLHANNDYAIGLSEVFSNAVSEEGLKILSKDQFNDGDTDFRMQLSRIKQLSPDAVYMTGYYKELAKILIQKEELRIQSQFLSCGTFPEPEILNIAKNAAEGVIFVQPYFSKDNPDSIIQNFMINYEKLFKSEAGVYAAHGYDALNVIISAILMNGVSVYKLRENILRLYKYHGVTGEMTFNSSGDVNKTLRVMIVKNNNFVELNESKLK